MTRDDLLALGRPTPVAVDLPDAGRVHLLPLSLPDLLAAEAEQAAAGDDPQARARWMAGVVARSLCDAEGRRLLAAADADALLAWRPALLALLFKRASEISRVSDDGEPEKN